MLGTRPYAAAWNKRRSQSPCYILPFQDERRTPLNGIETSKRVWMKMNKEPYVQTVAIHTLVSNCLVMEKSENFLNDLDCVIPVSDKEMVLCRGPVRKCVLPGQICVLEIAASHESAASPNFVTACSRCLSYQKAGLHPGEHFMFALQSH